MHEGALLTHKKPSVTHVLPIERIPKKKVFIKIRKREFLTYKSRDKPAEKHRDGKQTLY